MNLFATKFRLPAAALPVPRVPGRLFRRCISLFVAVVCLTLMANGILEMLFAYHQQKASLIRLQREQAEAAVAKIVHFIKEIESLIELTTQLPWVPNDLN